MRTGHLGAREAALIEEGETCGGLRIGNGGRPESLELLEESSLDDSFTATATFFPEAVVFVDIPTSSARNSMTSDAQFLPAAAARVDIPLAIINS